MTQPEEPMLKGARTLVDVCTRVKARETVLVVAELAKLPIAQAIAEIARARGAEVVIALMEPRRRAGEEPPAAIAQAMLKADVIFTPISFSITHTHAVKNAVAAGARAIVMTDFREEMLVHGGIEADFTAIRPVCQAVARRLAEGRSLRLTTPGGTDLVMDITGRRGNALTCIVAPGEFSTVPTVEANTSPIEGRTEGVIVCDASIPYLGIGLIEEPVRVTVEKGFIVDIQGGRQACVLREDLAGHHDPNVYNIAEIGVGLNPLCRMCGLMLEDEGVLSTAHIGIGTSITLGGLTKAAVHYDLLMWHPRIEVDGRILIDGIQNT